MTPMFIGQAVGQTEKPKRRKPTRKKELCESQQESVGGSPLTWSTVNTEEDDPSKPHLSGGQWQLYRTLSGGEGGCGNQTATAVMWAEN